MADFEIAELPIPATLSDPGGDEFIEMVRVRNIIEKDTVGFADFAWEAAELLPHYQNEYNPQSLYLARVDGAIVARGIYEAPIEEGSNSVWFSVEVLPDFRRRGIGSALFDVISERAEREGRTVLQSFALTRPSDGPQLIPPTEFGSFPADSEAARFFVKRGFHLEQVERSSRLELPLDENSLRDRIADAQASAGDDYRVVRWKDAVPDEWVNDIALLHERMSTDAPTAGLDSDEEDWDEARVRNEDALRAKSPRRFLTTAALHVPSNTLVAFSELNVPPELDRPVDQNDTLVIKEHRGHRLGMLLKLANLEFLQQEYPGHPAVTTFNAEENRPMLDVNEALGFVPIAYEGGWRLDRS